MAKLLRLVKPRHDCLSELARDIDESALGLGSIAGCSCGKRYILRQHQLDGKYWSEKTVSDPYPTTER